MKPAQVLDIRADLKHHLETSVYASYMAQFLQDMVEKSQLGIRGERLPAQGKVRDRFVVAGENWCRNEARIMEIAESHFVAGGMTPVILWAAAQLDGTDQFRRDMLPSEMGFAWFDEPWRITDVWGHLNLVRALSWRAGVSYDDDGGQTPGVWLTQYSDASHPDDLLSQRVREAAARNPNEHETLEGIQRLLGRLQAFHFEFIPWGQRVGPALTKVSDETAAKLMAVAAGYKSEWSEMVYQDPMHEYTNDQRLLLAYWMLLNQTLVQTEEADIPRAFRRRAQRMRIPPRVSIIKLRRTEHPQRHEGESLVEWNHRWIVKGHWAWRKCGPNHPMAEPYEKGHRVRVWINPFAKGPEDKPFVQSEKIYSLER